MKEPSLPTIKKLFALSGNICAFPSCQTPLVEDSGTVTGKICHIKAKNKNGPRYDKKQTDEERNSYENLILLCGRHHDIIDKEFVIYDAQTLFEMKKIKEDISGRKEKTEDNFFARLLLNKFKQEINIKNNTAPITLEKPAVVNIDNRGNRKKAIPIVPPDSSIGQDLKASGYISHLIKRYNKYANTEPTRKTKFSYGALSNNISNKFGREWKLISIDQFPDVVDYIHERIYKTRQAKNNIGKGYKVVSSFEEYIGKYFKKT